MSRVQLLRSVLAATVLAACLPGAASAAITIGHHEGPAADWAACPTGAAACGVLLPDVVTGTGVITQVTFPVESETQPASVGLEAFRGYPDAIAVVTGAVQSTTRTVPGAKVRSVRLPVVAGDRIGITRTGPNGVTSPSSAPVAGLLSAADDVVSGGAITRRITAGTSAWSVEPGQSPSPLMTVTIEPDIDGDGYGDETQDACLEAAGPRCDSALTVTEDPRPQAPFGPAVRQTYRVRNGGGQSTSFIAALAAGPKVPPAVTVSLDGVPCPATPRAALASTLSAQLDFANRTERRWSPASYASSSFLATNRVGDDPAPPVCGPKVLAPGVSAAIVVEQAPITLEAFRAGAVGGPLTSKLVMWGTHASGPTYPVAADGLLEAATPRATAREAYGDVDYDTKIRSGWLGFGLTCDKAVAPSPCHFRLLLDSVKRSKKQIAVHGRTLAVKRMTVKAGKTAAFRVKLPKAVAKAAQRSRKAKFHLTVETRLDGLDFLLQYTTTRPFRVGYGR